MGRFGKTTSTHQANQFIGLLVIGCVSPCKCTRLCVLLTLCFVAVGLPALRHHHSAIPSGMSSGFSKKQSAIRKKTSRSFHARIMRTRKVGQHKKTFAEQQKNKPKRHRGRFFGQHRNRKSTSYAPARACGQEPKCYHSTRGRAHTRVAPGRSVRSAHVAHAWAQTRRSADASAWAGRAGGHAHTSRAGSRAHAAAHAR